MHHRRHKSVPPSDWDQPCWRGRRDTYIDRFTSQRTNSSSLHAISPRYALRPVWPGHPTCVIAKPIGLLTCTSDRPTRPKIWTDAFPALSFAAFVRHGNWPRASIVYIYIIEIALLRRTYTIYLRCASQTQNMIINRDGC